LASNKKIATIAIMKKTKKQTNVIYKRILIFAAFLAILVTLAYTFERVVGMASASQYGLPWLISSCAFAWAVIYSYVNFYTRKLEHRSGWPSELSVKPMLFFSGVILSALVVAVQIMLIKILGSINFESKAYVLNSIFMVFGWAIFASVWEEVVFRGVVLRFIEKHIGTIAAIILSAVLFGMPHMFNPGSSFWTGFSIALGGGIMLGSVYALTRNLWASIGIHFGWDAILGIVGFDTDGVFKITANGPKWLIGDGAVSTYDPVFIICIWITVAVICVLFAYKKNRIMSYSFARKKLKLSKSKASA
jgi:membrane protease YdiL (CAAX protease family)